MGASLRRPTAIVADPSRLVMTNNGRNVYEVRFEGADTIMRLTHTTTNPWTFVVDTPEGTETGEVVATTRNAKEDTDWGWVIRTVSGKTYKLAPPELESLAYAYVELNAFFEQVFHNAQLDMELDMPALRL